MEVPRAWLLRYALMTIYLSYEIFDTLVLFHIPSKYSTLKCAYTPHYQSNLQYYSTREGSVYRTRMHANICIWWLTITLDDRVMLIVSLVVVVS